VIICHIISDSIVLSIFLICVYFLEGLASLLGFENRFVMEIINYYLDPAILFTLCTSFITILILLLLRRIIELVNEVKKGEDDSDKFNKHDRL